MEATVLQSQLSYKRVDGAAEPAQLQESQDEDGEAQQECIVQRSKAQRNDYNSSAA